MSAQGDRQPHLRAATPAASRVSGSDGALGMDRRDDGTWCYVGTDIPVPGAVEQTLGDVADVLVVSRRGKPPQSVLLTRAQVDSDPALAWVPGSGTLLRGADEDRFEVPWPVWEEQAALPVGVRAPERDGEGFPRRLAVEERELRFARRHLESLIEKRDTTVAVVSALGMTRREVSQITGLSTGRIQQVIDEASPILRSEVDGWLRDVLGVLRDIGPRSPARELVTLPAGRDATLLDELVDCGLITELDGEVRLTAAGDRAELHLRTAKGKASSKRG